MFAALTLANAGHAACGLFEVACACLAVLFIVWTVNVAVSVLRGR